MFFLATAHNFLRICARLLKVSAVSLPLGLAACKKDEAGAPPTPAEQGRKVYMSLCISCHNTNPKLDGGLGPAVWGSSKELLEARILHGKYPEGYKPKRESKLMTAFPHLKNDIEALHAFLNAE